MYLFRRLTIVMIALSLLSLLGCKTPDDSGSMQPYDGYPYVTSLEEIKGILKHRCVDTIKFRCGEIIANIGAGNGYIEAMLSIFNDSLTFYIQDIDKSVCNQPAINDVMDFYQEVNGRPFTNKFVVVNGTDTDTNLPDSTFDKILMFSDGDNVQIGQPDLDGVSVNGRIMEQDKAKKIIVFKYKRRKRYRKTQGHRQQFTTIKIDSIEA